MLQSLCELSDTGYLKCKFSLKYRENKGELSCFRSDLSSALFWHKSHNSLDKKIQVLQREKSRFLLWRRGEPTINSSLLFLSRAEVLEGAQFWTLQQGVWFSFCFPFLFGLFQNAASAYQQLAFFPLQKAKALPVKITECKGEVCIVYIWCLFP